MSDAKKKMIEDCPKCGAKLSRWLNPDDSSWGLGYQMVCFNDDCPYYINGWKWMEEKYARKASYRYSFNPDNGVEGPLPVSSKDSGRGNIIQEDDEV